MDALVFKHTEAFGHVRVRDRFEFEDLFLNRLVPPRPCQSYQEHEASPHGIRVVAHPATQGFEARSYLEFAKQILGETHFHVMQEGQPTGFTVILR